MASDDDSTQLVNSNNHENDTDSANDGNSDVGVPEVQPPEIVLAVVGKSGTGKSSLCNQLVGGTKFPTGHGLRSITLNVQKEKVERYGHRIIVVDTPDFGEDRRTGEFTTQRQGVLGTRDSAESPEGENSKIIENFAFSKLFKLVILLCVRCDARYAAEEHSTYLDLKRMWGDDEDFCRRLLVVFTHADELALDDSDEDNAASNSLQEGNETEQQEKQKQQVLEELESTRPSMDEKQQTDATPEHRGETKTTQNNDRGDCATENIHGSNSHSSQEERRDEDHQHAPSHANAEDHQPAPSHANAEDHQPAPSHANAEDHQPAPSHANAEDHQPAPSHANAEGGEKKETKETSIHVREGEKECVILVSRSSEAEKSASLSSLDAEACLSADSSERCVDLTSDARTKSYGSLENSPRVSTLGTGTEDVQREEEQLGHSAPSIPFKKTAAEIQLEKVLLVTWPQLQSLLKDAGHRFVLFNNTEGNRDENGVKRLLDVVVPSMDLRLRQRKEPPKDETKPRTRIALFKDIRLFSFVCISVFVAALLLCLAYVWDKIVKLWDMVLPNYNRSPSANR